MENDCPAVGVVGVETLELLEEIRRRLIDRVFVDGDAGLPRGDKRPERARHRELSRDAARPTSVGGLAGNERRHESASPLGKSSRMRAFARAGVGIGKRRRDRKQLIANRIAVPRGHDPGVVARRAILPERHVEHGILDVGPHRDRHPHRPVGTVSGKREHGRGVGRSRTTSMHRIRQTP